MKKIIFFGIFLATFCMTMTANSFADSPLATPTGLSAKAVKGQVTLSWNASTGAKSYIIKRSIVSGGPYIDGDSYTVNTTYVDNVNQKYGDLYYYYVVSAFNGNVQSANSAEVSGAPFPATPTGLKARAGNLSVTLSWNLSSGATSYNLKRSTVNGGPYTTVKSYPNPQAYQSVTGGTTYYYVVSGVNALGESANSAQVSATTPAVPTGLTATPGNNQVVLSWDSFKGATSYNVKKMFVSYGTQGLNIVPVYTIRTIASVTNTTYTDKSVTNGTLEMYYVSAVTPQGETPHSESAFATPTAPPSKGTGTGTTGKSSATSGTATTSTNNPVGNGTIKANVANYVKNNADGSQTLTGHMPLEVKNGAATFKYHASQTINAQVIMPLGNQSELSSLLQGLYDPKNPNFHHFLTPTQFAQQFAPSSIDSTQVQEFLKAQGISVTGQSSNGAVLNVSGSVGSFEHAFGLHINNYQKADGTMFFAPDADPTIPATIAGKVLAVGGLDNLPKYHAHFQQATNVLQPKAVSSIPGSTSTGSVPVGTGPGGYLAPSDVMTAYNLNSVPSNGSGQNIALFELDGYSSNDITAYESQFSLPAVPLQNIPIDGFNGVPNYGTNGGATEVTLDVETVAAFAPGSNILVYEAPNTTQSWIDEWTQIATDNKASVISCSWGTPEQDSATINFDNMIFAQMSAQGQAVFVAAGDSGAYDGGGTTLAVDEPAAQPYVTAVGISSLTTNPDGSYNSEAASTLGGGGVSVYQTIPSYQAPEASSAVSASMVSTTMRNVPDVVFTADASTPYAFYINGSWSGLYGSSISSPIWASFIARVDQGVGAPIGSVNSMLYQLAQSSTNTNDFNGITTGNNGYYPAEPGYNDATGIGSFNGLNLFNDLLLCSNEGGNQPVPAVPAAPTGLTATPSSRSASLSWTASAGATSYNIKRSTTSGGPYTTITTGATGTTYNYIGGLTNGTAYYYVVSAVNAAGESVNSNEASVTPAVPAPTWGIFGATAGDRRVQLLWNYSLRLGTSYNVKRSTTNGGPYTTIATVNNGFESYDDNSVNNGTTYYYVVSAVNGGDESVNSTQVSATPAALTAPVATATAGNGYVALSWTASAAATTYAVYRATSNSGPFTSPIEGGLTTTSCNDTTVSNGTTYYYQVSAWNAIRQHADSIVVSATPSGSIAPAAPTGLTATAGNASVALSWNPSIGAASYNVKRSTTSGGPYTTIVTGVTNTSYANTSLTNGTAYYYVVSAVNTVGEGTNSAQASATPSATSLAPPTGLSASAPVMPLGSAQVILTWTASTGATSYNVKRSTTSGGPYTTIASSIANTTYTDDSVSNFAGAPTYYYVVSAVNAGGQSANSAQVSATPSPYAAPTGLTATPGNGQVVLSWNATKFGQYSLQKSTVNGGPYTWITLTTQTSYTDTSVTGGTTYYYVVSAGGPNSSQVSATLLPSVPTGLTATAGNGQVALAWTASTGATSYNVKRSTTDGGPYTTVGSPTAANYADTAATNGTTYYYVVSAVGTAGQSANSAQVSASPLANLAPVTPTNVRATRGNGQVNVSWDQVTPYAPSYKLKRSTTSGGPYTVIGTIHGQGGVSYRSYTDTPLTNGTTYYYVVSSVNWAGQESTNSSEVSATPIAPPSAPTGLSATGGNGQVSLSWTATTGATSYRIDRATTNGGPYTTVGTSSNSSYTDTTVTNGTTYYYVVVAGQLNGSFTDYSTNSAQVSATPVNKR